MTQPGIIDNISRSCYYSVMPRSEEQFSDNDPFGELRGWDSPYVDRILVVLFERFGVTEDSPEYAGLAKGITNALFIMRQARRTESICSPPAELAVIWGIKQFIDAKATSAAGRPTLPPSLNDTSQVYVSGLSMNVSYSHWYGEYSPAGISESGVARVHTATRNIQIRPGQVLNRRTLGVMEISPSTANPSTSYIILDDPELAPGISRFALTTIGHGTLDRSELN